MQYFITVFVYCMYTECTAFGVYTERQCMRRCSESEGHQTHAHYTSMYILGHALWFSLLSSQGISQCDLRKINIFSQILFIYKI